MRLLECPVCPLKAFLEVASPQWIYPLQRLDPGVAQRINDADEALLGEAISKLQYVDYKTVSIVGFERKILGMADR